MGYAIRNDGQGWHSVNSPDDITADETYSESQPVPDPVVVAENEKQSLLDTGRAMRETVLARLNGIQLDAMIAGDSATVTAIATTKQELKDITIWPDVVSSTDGATKTAFLARYYEIVAELEIASPYAVTAFRGLDL